MPKIDETGRSSRCGLPCSRYPTRVTSRRDRSARSLAEMIGAAGHELAERAIVRRRAGIRARGPRLDCGSRRRRGYHHRRHRLHRARRDAEAVRPLFEKEIDGFSTVFHMISFDKVATSTIQSRATAGAPSANTFSACRARRAPAGTPGTASSSAARLPPRPCNFVEIMPRLEEHRRKGDSVSVLLHAHACAFDRNQLARRGRLINARVQLINVAFASSDCARAAKAMRRSAGPETNSDPATPPSTLGCSELLNQHGLQQRNRRYCQRRQDHQPAYHGKQGRDGPAEVVLLDRDMLGTPCRTPDEETLGPFSARCAVHSAKPFLDVASTLLPVRR